MSCRVSLGKLRGGMVFQEHFHQRALLLGSVEMGNPLVGDLFGNLHRNFLWKIGGTSPERSFPENFLGRTSSEKNSCGRKFSLKRKKCHFTEMRGQRLQWNFGLWASEHLVHKKNFLVANFLIKNVFPKENARIGETSKSCPFEKLATIPRVNYFRPETEME